MDKEDIRALDEKFLQLPFQGVPAKLAGIYFSILPQGTRAFLTSRYCSYCSI